MKLPSQEVTEFVARWKERPPEWRKVGTSKMARLDELADRLDRYSRLTAGALEIAARGVGEPDPPESDNKGPAETNRIAGARNDARDAADTLNGHLISVEALHDDLQLTTKELSNRGAALQHLASSGALGEQGDFDVSARHKTIVGAQKAAELGLSVSEALVQSVRHGAELAQRTANELDSVLFTRLEASQLVPTGPKGAQTMLPAKLGAEHNAAALETLLDQIRETRLELAVQYERTGNSVEPKSEFIRRHKERGHGVPGSLVTATEELTSLETAFDRLLDHHNELLLTRIDDVVATQNHHEIDRLGRSLFNEALATMAHEPLSDRHAGVTFMPPTLTLTGAQTLKPAKIQSGHEWLRTGLRDYAPSLRDDNAPEEFAIQLAGLLALGHFLLRVTEADLVASDRQHTDLRKTVDQIFRSRCVIHKVTNGDCEGPARSDPLDVSIGTLSRSLAVRPDVKWVYAKKLDSLPLSRWNLWVRAAATKGRRDHPIGHRTIAHNARRSGDGISH